MPTLFGTVAWSLVVGVAMVNSDLTILQALGMSLLVFAGAAQVAALPLMMVGAPIWIIFLTCVIINLRFVIFSVILAPHFSHLIWRQRLLWSYLSGDMVIVLFTQRYPTHQPEAGKLEYLKGLAIPNWLTWQASSIAGIFLASQIPEEWNIGYAGLLAILCLLLPMVMNITVLVGAIVAGIVAVATDHWPYKLGLLLAIIVGMVCAILWQGWRDHRDKRAKEATAHKESP